MKSSTYQNAVDHLEFTDLYDGVLAKVVRPKHRYRTIRIAAFAAAMISLLVFGAFAADIDFKQISVNLLKLGSVDADMGNAQRMEFQKLESADGVSVHYLELDIPGGYSFKNGLIYHQRGGIYQISSDYQLVPVEGNRIQNEIEKKGTKFYIDYQYVKTGTEIIVLNGAQNIIDDQTVLANAWSKDQYCWPVILNLETGMVTDALPHFSPDDFEGRTCYSEPFREGILLTTIKSSDVFVDGVLNSYNKLYYIKDGRKLIEIELPKGNNSSFYCENNTIYWKSGSGPLYQLNDQYEFQQIDELRTTDDLSNGLLTGRGTNNTLVVNDYYSNRQYVIDEITPDRWDFYETTGYNASRYSEDGKILITYSFDDYEGRTRRITEMGLLDPDSGTLNMLETHSNFKIYTFGWLDDNRFAIIYEKGVRKYICIYEFE